MAVTLKITIAQNNQSVANNSSNVTVKVIASWTYGSYNNYQKPGWVKIDGTQYDFTSNFNTSETTSGSKTLYTKTLDIKHGSDGKKTLSCSASFTTGVSSGTVTASASKALTDSPRAATITGAPNFNDESLVVITYKNPAGSAVEKLEACISLDGSKDDIAYRDISETGTSYTFNLTDAERNVLRQATTGSNSRTVRFYVATTIGGTTYRKYLTKTFSIANPKPTISNLRVVDMYETTKALTGDENTIIKFYSRPKVTATLAAVKGATLKSYKINNNATNNISGSSYSVDTSYMAAEGNTFKLEVVDSRGNVTTQTVTKTLLNYVKLTCKLSAQPPSPTGNLDFTVKGNYFNNTFGAVRNTLQIQYRRKVNDGMWGDWVTVTTTPTYSGNTYSVNVSLTGLDYLSTYVFQARAIDKLATVNSSMVNLKTTPVFDWGENDFKFNVNVNMSNNIKLNGITTDGKELNAFQAANGNNNCVIGYGGYTEAIGATNLYGNDVNILTNSDLTVNNGTTVYSILGAMKAMTTAYELTTTVTAGSGYSDCEATAYLVGNNLRIYLKATRSSNTGTGDIVNETVMSIKVAHGGKIKNLYATGFANSATGAPATFFADTSKTDDNNYTLSIKLCGASVADNAWSAHFSMPCTLNLSAYV